MDVFRVQVIRLVQNSIISRRAKVQNMYIPIATTKIESKYETFMTRKQAIYRSILLKEIHTLI